MRQPRCWTPMSSRSCVATIATPCISAAHRSRGRGMPWQPTANACRQPCPKPEHGSATSASMRIVLVSCAVSRRCRRDGWSSRVAGTTARTGSRLPHRRGDRTGAIPAGVDTARDLERAEQRITSGHAEPAAPADRVPGQYLPLADGRRRIAGAVAGGGLSNDIVVDSAGIGAWHAGEPPDARTIATAARHGVDISALRARHCVPTITPVLTGCCAPTATTCAMCRQARLRRRMHAAHCCCRGPGCPILARSRILTLVMPRISNGSGNWWTRAQLRSSQGAWPAWIDA